MALIFLFIDGVGIGESGASNPLTYDDLRLESFHLLTDGQNIVTDSDEIIKDDLVYKKIDACLGMEGLPQSGTGQATLFSGKNAAKILGRHFGPYPHSKIRFLLEEESIFHQVQSLGGSCYFMNAFPELFFERAKARNRWSCCTLMTKSSGLHINTVTDVIEERAITAEILQDAWKEKLYINVPVITEEDAAQRVINTAKNKDFILVEYYLTDKAGHKQDMTYAVKILQRYDRFLTSLLVNKTKEDTIILTSDHGNIEDLSVKTHTLNNVPFFAHGPEAGFFKTVQSITDVYGTISEVFRNFQA